MKKILFSILASLLLVSCSKKYEYAIFAKALVRMTYLFQTDSICAQSCGQISLWTIDRDSLQVKSDLFHGCEGDEINLVDLCCNTEYEYGFKVPIDDIYIPAQPDISPFQISQAKKNSIGYKEATETTKICEKSNFELICGKEIYGSFLPDSIGIFNATRKGYGRYRRVNGLGGSNIAMQPVGNTYDFYHRWPQPAVTQNGDTMPPLWLRFQLPGNVKRMAVPNYYDMVWDYGDGQYLWLHISPFEPEQTMSHCTELSRIQADSLVNDAFPVDIDPKLMDMEEIRRQLLNPDDKTQVRLRTNRAFLISSGIRRENAPLFSTMLKLTFIEEEIPLMNSLLAMSKDYRWLYGEGMKGLEPKMDEFWKMLDLMNFIYSISNLLPNYSVEVGEH